MDMENVQALRAATEHTEDTGDAGNAGSAGSAGSAGDAGSAGNAEYAGNVKTAESAAPAGEAECCCCCRTKSRPEKEQKDLINRLSRIEGQIRGLKGMIEREAYCIDIINQAAAASNALTSFSKVLLTSHIRTCVAEDVREGNDEKVDELVKTLQKLLK